MIFRELDELWAIGVLLGNLGAVAMAVEDFDRAVSLHEENLSIARQLKDQGSIGRELCNLAEAMQMRGDGDQDALLNEALELHRETHDKQCEISTLTLMANSALDRGETSQAARLYAESISLCQSIGDRTTIATTALLERIAALALATAQPRHAARLLGASDKLRQELGAPIMPYLRPVRERALEQIRSQIATRVIDAAIAQGHSLSPHDAFHEALAICERAQLSLESHCVWEHDIVLAASPHTTSP